MRLNEIKSSYLFHSLRMSYAEHALKQNKLFGTVSHRFLPNGKPLKNLQYPGHFFMKYRNNPETLKSEYPEIYKDIEEYESSIWIRGISLTRSRKFAEEWNSVVFVLDQEKLIQNYKIKPMNWLSSPYKYKKEQEEFLMMKKMNTELGNLIDKEEEIKDSSSPYITLDKYLISIYISPTDSDLYTIDKIPDVIKNHKKFILTP